MKKIIGWVLGALFAITLIGAPSAAFAEDRTTHLPAPVQLDVCADGGVYDDAHWDLPEVEGVFYGIYYYPTGQLDGVGWEADFGWQPGDEYLVLAGDADWSDIEGVVTVEESDYTIVQSPDGVTVAWWFPDFETCNVVVTPKAVTWVNPAGPNNLQPVFTNTAEYTYSVTRYSTGKVKVVATANPGYSLSGTTQWSKLDSN